MNPIDSLNQKVDPRSFLTYRLASLQNRLNAQAARVLTRHSDLTLTEWRVLLLASVWNKKSMAEMTREASMDKGQVSRAVKSLQGKGYLSTSADRQDARARILRVTDEGLRVKDAVLPRMLRRQQRLVRDLSEAERTVFFKALDCLEDAARIDDF